MPLSWRAGLTRAGDVSNIIWKTLNVRSYSTSSLGPPQIASAAVVTWHKGREAAALAAAFNAAPLPAVIYLPPNCITGVSSECTCGFRLPACLV